jgi:hypothetical protein
MFPWLFPYGKGGIGHESHANLISDKARNTNNSTGLCELSPIFSEPVAAVGPSNRPRHEDGTSTPSYSTMAVSVYLNRWRGLFCPSVIYHRKPAIRSGQLRDENKRLFKQPWFRIPLPALESLRAYNVAFQWQALGLQLLKKLELEMAMYTMQPTYADYSFSPVLELSHSFAYACTTFRLHLDRSLKLPSGLFGISRISTENFAHRDQKTDDDKVGLSKKNGRVLPCASSGLQT